MCPDDEDYAFLVKTAKSPHMYARDPFASKLRWPKIYGFLDQYPDGSSVLTTSRARACVFSEAGAQKFVREAPIEMVVESLGVFATEKEFSMSSDPRLFAKNREDFFLDDWRQTRILTLFIMFGVLIATLAMIWSP